MTTPIKNKYKCFTEDQLMSQCPLSHTIFDLERHSYGPPPPHLTSAPVKCYPKLKNVLRGRYFGTLENIQKSATGMLKTILVEDFQCCYQKWEQRLHRYVTAQRELF